MKVLSIDAELLERPDFMWLCEAEHGCNRPLVLYRVLSFYRWAEKQADREGLIRGVEPSTLGRLFGGDSHFWLAMANPNVGWVEWLEGGGLKLVKGEDLTDIGAITMEVPGKREMTALKAAASELFRRYSPSPKPADPKAEAADPAQTMKDIMARAQAEIAREMGITTKQEQACKPQWSGPKDSPPETDAANYPHAVRAFDVGRQANFTQAPAADSQQTTGLSPATPDVAARLEEQAKNASAIEP